MTALYYSLYNPTSGVISASYLHDSNAALSKADRFAARPDLAMFETTELLDPKKWVIQGGVKVARPVSGGLFILRNNQPSPAITRVLTAEGEHWDVHVTGGDVVGWENFDGQGLTRIQGPVVNGVKIDEMADWTFSFKTPEGPGEYEFLFSSGTTALPTKVKVIAHVLLQDDAWV